MNTKHILIVLLLNNLILSTDSSSQTEEEKEIKSDTRYTLINRELNLYYYDIAIGSSSGVTPNIAAKFNSGKFISLLISTPYKTPNIMNRFQFNVAGELTFKSFPTSEINLGKDFNITSLYLLFHNHNLNKHLKLNYGLGISHLFRSDTEKLAPSIKTKIEYQINFHKIYMYLAENNYINRNVNIINFLEKEFQLSIGIAPELILGYPYSSLLDGEVDTTLATAIDFYLKINLFNL